MDRDAARRINSPLTPVMGGAAHSLPTPKRDVSRLDNNFDPEDPEDMNEAECPGAASGIVSHLRGLLGKDVVLLPIPSGQKGPITRGWQTTTVATMSEPAYLESLARGNIGVVLGRNSGGLCSIDFDTDAAGEEFLSLNPPFRETLRSRGSRGFNCWVRIVGKFPVSGKLTGGTLVDGKPSALGEWRANGNQTVIHGIHPSGCHYERFHEVLPIEVPFESIVWPDMWSLPWRKPLPTVSVQHSVPSDAGSQIIILPGGKVSITECADQIFRRIAPAQTLFIRGGAIMERTTQDDGTISLALVKPAAFRSRIEGFGALFAWRSGSNGGGEVLKPTTCPEETANALMETMEAREHLPRIASVVNCPVALETGDGLRILGQGYHPENGGVLVIEGDLPPEVPIGEAVEAIKALLEEFEFQTPGDRSRALASLITPALKLGGFLQGFAPADVAEADQSQSGKTYRQRVLAAIYNESPRLIAARNGGVGSVDESFAQALIGGKPFIQFDNVRGKMDSQYIEAFLTATGSFAARVPHRGEIQVDPKRFLVLMTSNGVECTRDLANRSSIIRIRKRVGFIYQVYPEGDLLSHVKANQCYYLGCVFAVIREWIERGKLKTEVTDHDFREWAQMLDWIAQNILRAAPLLEGHQRAQQRVSDSALSFVRAVALEVRTAGRMDETFFAADIADLCADAGIDIPGLKSGNSDVASRNVGSVMKRAFGESDELEVDEFTVTRRVQTQGRTDGGGSYQSNSYRFRQQ